MLRPHPSRHAISALLVLAGAGSLFATPVRAEETRRWIVTCSYVKSANDDPIVFPKQPGASHLHDFYGNRGISGNTTTAASLNAFASGCPNKDRSAYWVPALYRNGAKLTPSTVQVYYENKSLAAGKVSPFPAGYKLLLGNARATTAAETQQHWVWACSDKTQYGDKPPTTCSSGGIQLRSEFPNCWDGKLAADGNAAGHVTWANGMGLPGHGDKIVDPAKNTCPAAYPKALPMIRIILIYDTGTSVGNLTLASGSVYSKHGDFFNAWDPATQLELVNRCLNTANVTCEHFKGTTPAP